MAHFARLDENNMVVAVTVVPDLEEHRGEEFLAVDLGLGGRWIQTSYNSFQNVHIDPITKEPTGKPALRKNYAGIGYSYDEGRDAFIPPKPEKMDSWIIDEETCWWIPPIPYPEDEPDGPFEWNEESLSWDLVFSPFPSWSWDSENRKWQSPIPCPEEEWNYWWDEEEKAWILFDEMI